jgi:antitoxin component YwqK of YwqJK toxin-antitoxin module
MNKIIISLLLLFVSISFSQVNTTYYDGTGCQCDSIKSEYYTESGRLFYETPYENGLLQGIEKVYSESGKLIAVTGYSNNLFIFITSLY